MAKELDLPAAASMTPLVAKGLAPVLGIEPALVSVASLPAVLALSPAGLVPSSAALALMSIGRFQFTAAGKLLIDTVQPLMHVQHTAALCDLNATALRFLLLARLKCSSQVQPSATLAMLSESHVQLFNVTPGGTLATAAKQPTVLSAARHADMMPSAVSRERHFELVDGADSRKSSLAVGVSYPSHVLLFDGATSSCSL